MEINLEVPDPETPPVETPPAAPPVVAVVAPTATPEAPTELAVMVGSLVTKVEQMETTLNGVKYTAEDALAIANRLANPPEEAPAVIEEIAPPVVVEADPVTPKGKRHWLVEMFL